MKVSVIMACFNSAEFINDALNSINSQDHDDVQLIVIDGGSTDGTLDILYAAGQVIDVLLSEPDRGVYDAMNKGLELATGDIVCFLNSDDFYARPSVLSDVVGYFDLNPDVDILLGNVEYVERYNARLVTRSYSSLNFRPWKLSFGFMPAHPATFAKKLVFEEVGFFNTDYRIAGDYEWFLRAFKFHDFKISSVNLTQVFMRQGGLSSNGLKSAMCIIREQYRALKFNGYYASYIALFIKIPIKIVKFYF